MGMPLGGTVTGVRQGDFCRRGGTASAATCFPKRAPSRHGGKVGVEMTEISAVPAYNPKNCEKPWNRSMSSDSTVFVFHFSFKNIFYIKKIAKLLFIVCLYIHVSITPPPVLLRLRGFFNVII